MTSNVVTRRFSLLMTGEVMGDMAPAQLAEGLAATSCPGVLVPGVLIWQKVTVTPGADSDVTVTAELLSADAVWHDGDVTIVTEDHIAGYILGAESYWYGQGDEFCPHAVTVLRLE